MALRSSLLLVLLVSAPALSAQSQAPAGQTPQRIQLRWKVPQGAPLGYEFVMQEVAPGADALRVDSSSLKKSGLTAEKRKALFEFDMPSQSAMATVLSAKPSGDLSAKVVVTRVEPPKKKKPSKADKKLAKAMQAMVGTVQLRANMTDSGFVTTDLPREQRNLVALMFELPSKPVAVGDVWSHSADLVKMGAGWEGDREALNRVELVALEKESEGRSVAVLDFTLAERHEGQLSVQKQARALPASMEMSFVGRGEFLVEEGRWRRLSGRLTTRATGAVKVDSEQQFLLTPLVPIPPAVLSVE